MMEHVRAEVDQMGLAESGPRLLAQLLADAPLFFPSRLVLVEGGAGQLGGIGRFVQQANRSRATTQRSISPTWAMSSQVGGVSLMPFSRPSVRIAGA
ncbi:MAG: hypothetical protein R3F40_10425 [Candidatus Competibacteraceae bacterium]